MVDIETYRARIGNFGASSLSTTKVKLKIKLRCKVQRQVSLKWSVQTLIFLWMVVSMTMLFVSLRYQEYVNTGMASSSHTDLVYSDKQLCMKYLFKHVHEFYKYILESYAKMLTDMSLLFSPSSSSTLAANIWIPGSNTQTTLMENICNGTVHGTCSYLIGNVGSHAYHGNPPKRRGENIYDLHRAMVFELSQMIAPGTGNTDMDREWKTFTSMLQGEDLLSRVEVARLKDMFDVFAILKERGKIDYGNYEVVKRTLSQLKLMQCHDIITEHEERMASTSQDGQHEEQMASTSQDGQHEERMASTSQDGQHEEQVASTSQGGQQAEKRRRTEMTSKVAKKRRRKETSEIGENTTSNPGRQSTEVMVKIVKKWEELDKNCYVTKAMENGKDKIQSENFLSVTGVPGSGKTTTLWNIAIYIKNTLGFTVYPILHPVEFETYFNSTMKQLFIWDDIIGEDSVSNDKLKAWNEHNDRIKSCLSKNTKILTSIRIQLWKDQSLQGRTYVFNDPSHCINLGHADFKLSKKDMKKMLRHYLEINGVDDIDDLMRNPWWLSGKFVDMFPLLCKVFSQNSAVRHDPYKFFDDPFEAMTDIFTQIKTQNKHQFCGLVLCSALDLNDDYFSRLCEHELMADKIQLRNVIMESLEVDTKELKRVKAALESLDGVYVTRVGNRFTFSHSLFQNIVTYLYDDSTFVFKYGTWQFICDRVRINKKLKTDNEYVLVYNSDTDIKRLADRFVQEVKHGGAWYIVDYPCIDDVRLLSVFIPQLFKSVSQDYIDRLRLECVEAVCIYRPQGTENTDITTWPSGGLLSSLLQSGVSCNTLDVLGMNGLHRSLYWNCPPLTKYLLQHPNTDINCTDKHGRCVLHYAVNNSDMTCYLLSQPHLTCVNQTDSKNRTPLWYVVHGRWPYWGSDGCGHRDVPDREKLIEMYKQKGGIMLDVKKDAWKCWDDDSDDDDDDDDIT